jgi:uncharacterized membrane protein
MKWNLISNLLASAVATVRQGLAASAVVTSDNGAMVHAEHTVTIDRPAVDVFAYLADATNDRYWRAGIISIERTSETAAHGATYKQVIRGPGGAHIAGDFTITEYQPDQVLGFEVTVGPVRPTGRFALVALGPARTVVTFTMDVTPTGGMRLMSKMIARELDAEVAHLDDFKKVLEQV